MRIHQPPSNQYNIFKLSHNLSESIAKGNELEAILKKLYDKFKLEPIIGFELEFLSNIYLEEWEKERGVNQYEVRTLPNFTIPALEELKQVKLNLSQYECNFASKPNLADYGNGLHIHINFHNNDILSNKSNLKFLACCLCNDINNYLAAFVNDDSFFQRLNSKFLAPETISWGGNNRTTIVRTPTSAPTRLEFRLPSSSTSPIIAVYYVLRAIYEGLSKPSSIKLIKKCFSNATIEHYEPLHNNYKTALASFNQKGIFFLN